MRFVRGDVSDHTFLRKRTIEVRIDATEYCRGGVGQKSTFAEFSEWFDFHLLQHYQGMNGLILDAAQGLSLTPERTSRCFGLGADIKNFAPELRSNNSSGLRSGTVCWWVAPPHQCVTTMKSVSFPVSWLNPLSEIINEEAGVRSLEILSTVSCGISMRLRTAFA